jgi:hypothetical protein
VKNRPDEGRASGKHYSMPVPSEQTLSGAPATPLDPSAVRTEHCTKRYARRYPNLRGPT